MHDGMRYDPIQGQGHEPLKVRNSAMTTDSYITTQYLKLIGAGFFILCPSFCVM